MLVLFVQELNLFYNFLQKYHNETHILFYKDAKMHLMNYIDQLLTINLISNSKQLYKIEILGKSNTRNDFFFKFNLNSLQYFALFSLILL
jgi:hypothetical protein